MILEIDPTVDAAYVEVTDHPVGRTARLGQDRMIDYDANDQVVGYEFLNVSKGVDLSDLPHRREMTPLFEDRNIRVFA